MEGKLFVPEKLKMERASKSLKAKKVAELIGKSAHTISDWERGIASPNAVNLAQLATIYKCSIADFFEGERPYEDPYYTSDEIELINCYRALTDEGKELLRASARVYAGEQDIRDR